jgi:hypothetical protein
MTNEISFRPNSWMIVCENAPSSQYNRPGTWHRPLSLSLPPPIDEHPFLILYSPPVHLF